MQDRLGCLDLRFEVCDFVLEKKPARVQHASPCREREGKKTRPTRKISARVSGSRSSDGDIGSSVTGAAALGKGKSSDGRPKGVASTAAARSASLKLAGSVGSSVTGESVRMAKSSGDGRWTSCVAGKPFVTAKELWARSGGGRGRGMVEGEEWAEALERFEALRMRMPAVLKLAA